MRLDKYLSDMGIGTRSYAKQMIRRGNVTVNGQTVTDPARHVSDTECVCCNGQPVAYEKFSYYMMNKPAGVISASSDPRQKTVLDLMSGERRKDLFPAGRLDKDTEGLLLITNDGALAHFLLSPSRHVDKVYYALVSGILTNENIRLFREGLQIDAAFTALPAELRILSVHPEEDRSEAEITIREGKFHQIKRMFHAVGKEVLFLKRLSMGSLNLDPSLAPGEYRRLTSQEAEALKADGYPFPEERR